MYGNEEDRLEDVCLEYQHVQSTVVVDAYQKVLSQA